MSDRRTILGEAGVLGRGALLREMRQQAGLQRSLREICLHVFRRLRLSKGDCYLWRVMEARGREEKGGRERREWMRGREAAPEEAVDHDTFLKSF